MYLYADMFDKYWWIVRGIACSRLGGVGVCDRVVVKGLSYV